MTKEVREVRLIENENILSWASLYYGFKVEKVNVSTYKISNGNEVWIIKMSKNLSSVRKLLHSNHSLCGLSDGGFHDQGVPESDLRCLMLFIYNHGVARQRLDRERNAMQARLFAVA